MRSKVVLITGVASFWGARLAKRLLAEPNVHVLGLDAQPVTSVGLDFVLADIRNPLLVDLLKSENVHTICHLQFAFRVRPSRGSHDLNVAGAMNLLNAARQAGVSRLVVKSSTMTYGAHPNNPAFLTEGRSLRGRRRYGYIRDLLEIEALCEAFRRETPQVELTQLRFANIVGPTADTPMTRFLRGKWAPALLGFDPMMQIIHEDDVLEALTSATLFPAIGVFNVAAEDPMPLSRLMALSGKRPVPILHTLGHWGLGVLRSTGVPTDRYAPIPLDYLCYSWVSDLTAMRQTLGFVPTYTAEETIREFAAHRRRPVQATDAEALAVDQKRLRRTIEQRTRVREQTPVTSTPEGDNE